MYVADVADLASQCDVLVPMCALTKQTEHLINQDVISQLKPDAGLINMSRGKVVDTDALIPRTSSFWTSSVELGQLFRVSSLCYQHDGSP
jgi:lactate dehydrogenase-like 2-hydroxyacid dehydrogenase